MAERDEGGGIAPVEGHRARAGADVGGTFTDIVLARPDGVVDIVKVASSPDDYGRATLEGIQGALAAAGLPAAALDIVVHGTTVATNAILEHRTARTALLTTRGFRDVLELRRVRAPELYDHFYRPPRPLVDRRLRLEVDERIGPDGDVLRPLDRRSVEQAIATLLAARVEAVAVSFLHAYRTAAHEIEVAAQLGAANPGWYVSISSDVLPEVGEYERTSTTVINAAIGPIVHRYLGSLRDRMAAAGVGAPVLLMQSNGALMALPAARRRPAWIVESGPAAGVIAGLHQAASLGVADAMTLDMGGTTTKASLIEGGRPTQTTEYEVGGGMSAAGGLGRGRGHALRLPVIDIAEVGAGGGSIVRVGPGGSIRVGPESAGAVPGPACYGTGGTDATITDANLVLGYLNPDVLAGGAVRLEPGRAHDAIGRHVAAPLDLSPPDAAHGVFQVAIATMARAVRAVSTYRGRRPGDFLLIAFGGNGPLFAAELARAMEIREVVVPPAAGLFSAVGLLRADEAQHLARACPGDPALMAPSELEAAWRDLALEGSRAFPDDGRPLGVRRLADLRYRGQASVLTVGVPDGRLTRAGLRALAAAFGDEHERTYGYRAPARETELVSVRLVVSRDRGGDVPLRIGPDRREVGVRHGTSVGRATRTRPAYFGARRGWIDTPLLARGDLGRPRRGPLIIEEYDATILVPPGCRAVLGAGATIRIQVEGR